MSTKNVSDERLLRRRYTLRYLVAMALIATTIVAGALQVRPVLQVNKQQAEIINVAGAQQMLSQRLALLPERILEAENQFRRDRALEALSVAVQRMRAGHTFLITSQNDHPAPARATPELTHFYAQQGLGLEVAVDRFIAAYEDFVLNPIGSNDLMGFLRIKAENELLVRLDRAVQLHTEAAEAKMAKAIQVHGMWAAAALALVLLVIVFIFRPMARDAAKSVANIGAQLDERAALLSKSMGIAKMGHWRAVNAQADPLWFSQELLTLYGMDLKEGFHPLSTIQAGDIVSDETPVEANTQHLAFKRTWETGQPTVARSQFRKPNGDIIDMLVHMEAEHDDDGNVVGVVGVIKDDTAEAEADRALIQSYEVIERRTKDLHEAQRLGKLASFRFDVKTDALEWDNRAFELLRHDPKTFTMTVENIRQTYQPDDAERANAMTKETIETGKTQTGIFRVQRGDGSIIDLQVRQSLERNTDGEAVAVFGTLQDVTKERDAARDLEKLAYYDHLTGLSNRTLFTRELERICTTATQDGQEAALFLIDLDHFKEVNDSMGHQAGDELLSIIGNRFANVVPTSDFVARLGGDEFALIIKGDVSRTALAALSHQISQAASAPAKLSLGQVQTNASVGIALIPEHSCEPQELLRFADLALYHSKEQGRGQASFYHERLSFDLNARMELAQEVTSALAEERFELHYQPLVCAKTMTVDGFEALMRLPKHGGGFISPTQFIPIAESSQDIAELGAFALHKACTEAQSWIDAGQPPRRIAVNVSAAQVWHGDLEAVVDSALKVSGLDPKLLCIELTESVFAAESINKLRDILTRLKRRGISLALDDFGTGYSSLGYLNQLPFDRLKIDRMFVCDAHLSAEKQKMLRGVISLSKGLNLKVTAEGVENKQEMRLVKTLGCDTLQGWFFSRALPSEQAVVEAARIDTGSALASIRKAHAAKPSGDAVRDALLNTRVAS